jgi:heme exporter protein B
MFFLIYLANGYPGIQGTRTRMRNILTLVRKEITLEWRNKYAFHGVLVYVLSTIFICYNAFRQVIDPPAWNALFWIILLFAAVNAVAKSFMQESKGVQMFYYTFLNPQDVILSRMAYNAMLLIVIAFVSFGFYILFLDNLVQDLPMFMTGILLGSAGFSSVLTLVSAIASRAGNSASLMAVLSFPILLPLLITTIRFSKNAMDGLGWTVNNPNLLILLAINGLVAALAYLLFPYIWKA